MEDALHPSPLGKDYSTCYVVGSWPEPATSSPISIAVLGTEISNPNVLIYQQLEVEVAKLASAAEELQVGFEFLPVGSALLEQLISTLKLKAQNCLGDEHPSPRSELLNAFDFPVPSSDTAVLHVCAYSQLTPSMVMISEHFLSRVHETSCPVPWQPRLAPLILLVVTGKMHAMIRHSGLK